MLRFIERENLHRVGIAIFGLSILGGIALWKLEPDHALGDWLWWSIVTITTVGYGDLTPNTGGGRVIGVMLMLFGIGTLGIATAALASVFVETKTRRDRGMSRIELADHHVLCGWGGRGEAVYRQLRSDPDTADTAVVIIDPHLEYKPVEDDLLHFVRGGVDEKNLDRANASRAKVVIILGDETLAADLRDAKVVLETLEVESYAPSVYTVVVVTKEEHARHCRRAQADEIIVAESFESRLVASSAVYPGLSLVISDLLSPEVGNDLTMLPVPENLAGASFADVADFLLRNRRSTLLAVRRDGQVQTNPPAEFEVRSSDSLVVITSREPESG